MSTLLGSLQYLASESSRLSNIQDDIMPKPIEEKPRQTILLPSDSPKSKRKKELVPETVSDEDFFKSVNEILNSSSSSFDESLDDLFAHISEDDELSNSLIAQGRKYARDHGASSESGEIHNAFDPQIRMLEKFVQEVDADAKGAQRDIDSLRMARTRNTKSLADLISAKSSIRSSQLSAIKEISALRKNMIDLEMKAKAAKAADNAAESEAAFAVQKLLSSDYSDDPIDHTQISGAQHSNSAYPEYEYSDEIVDAKYFNDDEEESEGDKYIKYEDRNVELHLQIDADGNESIVPIDKNGVVVSDYPLPPDVNELRFVVHDDLGIATDQLNREYILDRL